MSEAGLTLGQFGVLEALLHFGALCQRDLALKLLRSGGNGVALVDSLEREGLIERRGGTDGRRFVKVHLTPRGGV